MDFDSINSKLKGRGRVMVTLSMDNTSNELSFKGLSTDTKPTETWMSQKIVNGSTFFEMDTQEVFFYDEDQDDWLAQP